MTRPRRSAAADFRRLTAGLGRSYLTAAAAYSVTDLEPGEVEYVDADWDGDAAEASYPNPSDESTDLDFLADHYLFVPDMDDPAKSDYKCPIRMGPGGPVNVNALMACLQAINGARGGVEGIDTDTMRAGFDALVAHLVEAGEYDDADDAPDFDAGMEAAPATDPNHPVTAEYRFEVGDAVTWAEGSVNQAYGVIRDRAQSGDGVFGDRIDGDFALSPTEGNPGYLIEIYDELDDGWEPTGTMVGHRQSSISPWDPDKDLMEAGIAEARGIGPVRINAEGDDSLKGVIWGAGDHDLAVGGDPTPVHVPEDTIQPTFDALREDVADAEVTLGFDHPGQDSVAARTGIVDIGTADGVALSADGTNIVLTDSTLTNDQAAEAAAAGDFDSLDWSIVGDVAIRRDGDGDPVTTDDGRIVIDATRIRRIDAVEQGAVDAASIERDQAALPDLSSQTDTVEQAAAGATTTDDAVRALRASATALKHDMDDDPITTDPDDLADARRQLQAAADVIEDQRSDLTAAQAKADGFDDLIEAHGLTLDDFDTPAAAAQAVIDEQTADLRRKIASLEADLAQFDTTDADTDSRADDLAGKSPQDLEAMLNDRKATAFDVRQRQDQAGAAVAKNDRDGRLSAAGRDGSGAGADANDIARDAMDGGDIIRAQASGADPATYISDRYGLRPGDFDDAAALNAAIAQQMNDDGSDA